MDRTLYVITVVSNPLRYNSRYRLFLEFQQRMLATAGVQLIVVEQAFGDRPFRVTEAANRFHVQVRAGAESEVWVKESLINIGFRHLSGQCPEWQYAAWVDADVEFLRAEWATETVEALQHYRIVQPWSRSVDLGPQKQALTIAESFACTYWTDPDALPATGYYYTGCRSGVQRGHPGFAWAIRRETYEHLGRLIDYSPMGSGDHVMAWAFIGKSARAVDSRLHPAYKKRVAAFQKLCDAFVLRDLGYVEGSVLHHWHGPKKKRFYIARTKALVDAKFNPDRDLRRNHQGLMVLTGKNLDLRDTLRRYIRARDEDSMSLD